MIATKEDYQNDSRGIGVAALLNTGLSHSVNRHLSLTTLPFLKK